MKITLAAARKNAGFTQAEAAERIGVSTSTLVNWEKGRTSPKQTEVNKMCSLYDVEYGCIIF